MQKLKSNDTIESVKRKFAEKKKIACGDVKGEGEEGGNPKDYMLIYDDMYLLKDDELLKDHNIGQNTVIQSIPNSKIWLLKLGFRIDGSFIIYIRLVHGDINTGCFHRFMRRIEDDELEILVEPNDTIQTSIIDLLRYQYNIDIKNDYNIYFNDINLKYCKKEFETISYYKIIPKSILFVCS